MAVIREALCTYAFVVVGNLVIQKRSSVYFQELTSALRQRAFIPGTYLLSVLLFGQ